MELNTTNPEPENDQENKDRPETVKELASRHMKDENHVTTEEELRNATLDLPAVAGNTSVNVDVIDDVVNKEIPTSEDNDDKDKNRAVPNPYDVLSS